MSGTACAIPLFSNALATVEYSLLFVLDKEKKSSLLVALFVGELCPFTLKQIHYCFALEGVFIVPSTRLIENKQVSRLLLMVSGRLRKNDMAGEKLEP